jgi:hypothetical protein
LAWYFDLSHSSFLVFEVNSEILMELDERQFSGIPAHI